MRFPCLGKPLLKTLESFLHLLKMCMLASTHALAFRTLQCSLVGLPGSKDSELFGCRHLIRFDDVHWRLEFPGRIEFRVTDILLLVAHSYLPLVSDLRKNVPARVMLHALPAYSNGFAASLRLRPAIAWHRSPILGVRWPAWMRYAKRPSDGGVMRKGPPPQVLILTMSSKSITQ